MLAAGAAQAQDLTALMQKNGCVACHAVDKKIVGPSYQDVAAKYKGDAGAAAKLATKVKAGGTGIWGQVPMPPNPAGPRRRHQDDGRGDPRDQAGRGRSPRPPRSNAGRRRGREATRPRRRRRAAARPAGAARVCSRRVHWRL